MTNDDLEKELAAILKKCRDLSGSGRQYIRAARKRRTVLRMIKKVRELTPAEKIMLDEDRFDNALRAEAKRQGEVF